MDDVLLISYPVVDINISYRGRLPVEMDATYAINTVEYVAGGPANVLIVAARLGLRVALLGTVGDDYLGHFILSEYKNEGISTEHIRQVAGYKTHQVFVLVDDLGEHAYISMIDNEIHANIEQIRNSIDKVKALCLTGYTMVSQGSVEKNRSAVQYAKETGKLVFFDPGPMIPAVDPVLMADVISLSDYIALNRDEAFLLTGENTLSEAGKTLSKRTSGRVIIKDGAEGCYLFSDNKNNAVSTRHYPGFPASFLDSTGAGDSFMAALMYAVLQGWNVDDALTLANATGAVMVTKFGSGTNAPYPSEINEMLTNNGILFTVNTRKQM
ncbi:MAG TPA: carbohydrate kinase family protein [Clostridiaceae bacterium]|nr:carbohydrate kinase family protein [Clostridiaceae bacterium]